MNHTVKVLREGKWWIADVDGVPGAATEATRLADLEIEVRDLLSGLLDVDEDSFELSWDLTAIIGTQGQTAWNAYTTEKKQLAELQARYEADRLATLKALRNSGVSIRDIAAMVDLSHQRVAQLVPA